MYLGIRYTEVAQQLPDFIVNMKLKVKCVLSGPLVLTKVIDEKFSSTAIYSVQH